MTIYISAGHSNTDPGAVAGGMKEADLARAFRNAVAHYLREAGVKFETDGTGDTNAPLREACAGARRASVAVEFHFNASSKPSVRGVETLAPPRHKALAQRLSAAVAAHTGSPLRGASGYQPESISPRGRLGFIQAGGLIMELEFITNPEAMETYNSKYWLIAKDIAQILIDTTK